MTPFRARIVTACQQLLALAVVLAVLTPAARVVTLDVVGTGPEGRTQARPAGAMAAYTAEAVQPSRVPTAPVRPHVREVQLTAPTTSPAGRATTVRADARVVASPDGRSTITSLPQKVTGFGEVGVTWAHGVSIPQTAITITARTRTHGVWTPWRTIPYDPAHGPDPGSAEARHARPGTDPILVGRVAQVQVRAVTDRPLPADMQLAVVSPGRATHTADERAAIDTSTMDGSTGQDSVYRTGQGAALSAAVFTPQPVIYSRAQWGADERMREKASLHYGDVHAGFVHHTVNANNYTRAEVPGIIRSIYAYHVRSLGWSDIGYNFLIDRFGRIWEGRYGGVDRPVVGAHTLGYNDDSFGASAIGNYQIAKPSAATIQAFAALFAWKLSLHGVGAASTHQYVTSRYLRAVNGHRDAYPTLCPGQYLYDKIPLIRRLAAAEQRGWSGRQLESNLASTPNPDLVVRRARDGEGFIVPTGGLLHFQARQTLLTGQTGATGALVSPDLTGDGRPDLLVRQADGSLALHPGSASGGFGATARTLLAFRGDDQVLAPGDLDGDGRNDLVARNTSTGDLVELRQRTDGSFRQVSIPGWGGYDLIAAAGDLNGDGNPDLVARRGATLWWFAGDGHGGFSAGVEVPGDFSSYDAISGGGDFTADGKDDLMVRRSSSGPLYVLPGHGNGTFAPRLGPFTGPGRAGSPVVASVGGSRAPDVVGMSGANVVAWINSGAFDLGKPIDTGQSFSRANAILAVGDWDRDGYGDVVERRASNGNLYLLRGNGRGHLAAPVLLASGFGKVGKLAAVGDMTGDGYPDLMGQPRGGVMRIYPGKGLGGLRKSYPAYHHVRAGAQIGIGRWDADGAPDTMFRRRGTLTVYSGNGPGGLYRPHKLGIDLTPYDWVVGVSDLQLTGHPDLLVRRRGTGRIYALRGTQSGLRAPVYLGDGLKGYDLVG